MTKIRKIQNNASRVGHFSEVGVEEKLVSC
jgi:hypothetical protein